MPRPNVTQPVSLKDYFEKGMSWESWLKSAEDAGQAQRMNENRATVEVPAATQAFLQGLKRPVHVLAIAEDWCGDVVHSAPVMAKLAAIAPDKLRVKWVHRVPEVIVRYLTNGAEAIPKFVFLTETFVEIGNWGPRPEACKHAMARAKALGKTKLAYDFIGAYYEKDKHQSTIQELCALAEIAVAEKV